MPDYKVCILGTKGSTMNVENRATKATIKDMPPAQAEELIALFKIKSPYKEILHETCVKGHHQFEAMHNLSGMGICLGYRTFVRKQAKALEMFRVAYVYHKRKTELTV
jgi:hypothetical protein